MRFVRQLCSSAAGLVALIALGILAPPGLAEQERNHPRETPDAACEAPRGPATIQVPDLGLAHKATSVSARASQKRVPAPFDEPDEAERWYVMKRSPDGVSPIPTEKYFQALEKMRFMPQYSTAAGAQLPSRAELARSGRNPLAILGTWSWLGPGNIGGRTRALLIHPTSPSTMWAGGVAGGVWKTTNGGTTWAPLNDFLPNLAVTALAMTPGNPNAIYAGTGEGWNNIDGIRGAGIMKTTDGGATWNQLASTTTSDFYYVNKIIVSPNSANRVYAATRTGIFRSPDAGATWTKVYSSTIFIGVTDLAIRTDQPNDVMLASDGSFVQATIYRNTDAGGSGTWSPVYTEATMGRTSFGIAPSNQNVIYALSASIEAGDFNEGLLAVFQSTDGGGTWSARVRNTSPTRLNTLLLTNSLAANYMACGVGIPDKILNQGWYHNVIAVDPVNPNRVWVGGTDVFRSDDGGANWGLASYWWPPLTDTRRVHADNHAIVFHPSYNGGTNQTMFVTNDGGIFRTDNAVTGTPATGATAPCNTGNSTVFWTALNNNYGVTQFYHGLPYPNGTTYFGGAQDNGTNRGSDAAGPNAWAAILGGDGGYVAVDPGNTNILFGETTNLSLQKSTDGGATFAAATHGITEASSQFGFTAPFVMDPANSQRLWIGGRMPWRTTDGGANWTQAGTGFTTGAFPTTAIAVAPTDSNYVLFGRRSGFIARTTTALTNTATTTWPDVLPIASQPYNSWLTFDPVNKNVAYATYSTFDVPHVWKSTDAGATWASIDGSGSTAIPNIPVHCLVVNPTNTSRLYVGTDLGVFTSTDGGGSWLVENSGFANVVTESLALNGSTLFAFTHGRGVYRVTLLSGSGSAPTANFTYSANPKSGVPVQFTDTSTGGPTSWSWSFGDGGTSTAQNPSHTFTTGTYQVALTASNGSGSSTKTQTVVVTAGGATTCTADASTMCMVAGRYKVTSHWKNQFAPGAPEETLSKAALTDTTGAFWRFDTATFEYLIRFNTATDNGRIWVAIPTFTQVEFWIAVTDTKTGQYFEYHSPAGNQTLIYDPNYFVYP